MVDSLLDLGSVELWRIGADWRENPSCDIEFSRQNLEYEGGSHEQNLFSSLRLQKYVFSVYMDGKAEEKTLIEKFISLSGRAGKFWLPGLTDRFVAWEDIESADEEILVYSNHWDFVDESRFFIVLNNGDWISRKITGYEHIGDESRIDFGDAIGRDIWRDEIERFGLLHLCRLENDVLEIKQYGKAWSVAKIGVVEIPFEIE